MPYHCRPSCQELNFRPEFGAANQRARCSADRVARRVRSVGYKTGSSNASLRLYPATQQSSSSFGRFEQKQRHTPRGRRFLCLASEDVRLDGASEGLEVTVHYTGKTVATGLTVQTTWDRAEGPLVFTLGQLKTATTGAEKILLAIDRNLRGKVAGDVVKFELAPAEAFGERNPEYVRVIPTDVMKANAPGIENVDLGTEIQLPDGRRAILREKREDGMVIDLNHRLAGESLEFELTLLDVGSAQQVVSAIVSHILLADEAKAEELKAELDKGVAFALLAQLHSTCSSKADGGMLGRVKPGMLVPELDTMVWDADVGVAHGPVATDFGYHLLFIHDRAP
ncbi:hypothetical protein CYMTET_11621 [Cymbomonas tetramitiformis]|uniref:peptidylprolyl isomerase n=1 Tax=Cymbomonas tetramitiformis TaxID=36881 RepID=A0AAE0GM54_9CHLO|nr:hypothetical protein CYMTET_11621 [Cymbomonas tetramitiformis]